MDQVERSEWRDRADIQEVRARYAEGQDYQNWEAVKHLLTEQVAVDFSSMGGPVQSVPREALVQNFQYNLSRPGLKTQHLYTNYQIAIDGDTAICKTNFIGQHFLAGLAGGEEFHLRGQYEDTLVRTADGWKISAMKFTLFYTIGNPAILMS